MMMTSTLFPPSLLLPAVTVTACFFSNSSYRPLPVTYPSNYCYRFPLVTAVKQSRNINTIIWCKKCSGVGNEQGEEEGIIKVLCGINTKYNDILIVQTPNDSSRYLLLDSTHNVHSVYNEGQKWTGSYWDEFASLPAIVPKGPIAILGLGGGTAAHLMLELWPSLKLEGWEIDEILIDKAREYLGLSDLENHTPAGGILHVRIGDALSPSVHVPGGYAGIVIDLFADGKVLPQLTEVATWLKLNDKLMPNGRLMVNCGAAEYEVPDTLYPETSSDSAWEKNLSIKAMCQAFPGQLMNWKKMPKEEGENYLALTGPLPDLNAWSASVPDRLSVSVNQWRPCFTQ